MNHFDRLQLVLFSGKGGVGKTTVSCSFARRWAQQFPGDRILLLSTDPAHSIGDVLQTVVLDTPQPLPDLPNLQIRAIDAQALLQAFKQRYGNVLELLVERGSFVEASDLSPVWELNWPGLDELMGILEIQRILREQAADRVVVDMAPSGHTINLFGLMDFLDGFLGALDLFQEKHRVISQTFGDRYSPDAADAFLIEMKADLAAGRQLLQDVDRTACLIVAIPERLSFLETQRFLEALRSLNIPCGGLVINRLSRQWSATSHEESELLPKFSGLIEPLFGIPQQSQEPIGGAALDRLMTQAFALSGEAATERSQSRNLIRGKELPALADDAISQPLPDFLSEGKRLLLIGGKGGVGKTTVAGAIALALAERHPDRLIRIISIDPAHSLGDAFGQQLGHQAVDIAANLSAQEIDAKRVLEAFREDYLWELAEMMSGDSPSDALQLAYGPQAWRQIVSQALPGIDELLSLMTILELLEQGKPDLIILDTAPTGHLLRFLEMPTALTDWLNWIFKLWIKYQDVVGRTDLIGRLRTLRQRVVQTQKKLKDAQHTEFIGVLQAQSAIVAEAQRLTQTLTELGISQRYIVQNRVERSANLPANLQAAFPQQAIVQLPQLPHSAASIHLLQRAAQLLFS
jgi:arsenite/tail-anchored protein-transporting ATPase